jgi:hypothetical protein
MAAAARLPDQSPTQSEVTILHPPAPQASIAEWRADSSLEPVPVPECCRDDAYAPQCWYVTAISHLLLPDERQFFIASWFTHAEARLTAPKPDIIVDRNCIEGGG